MSAQSQRSEINDDIIHSIFTWLPAKSICRFKCVGKTFLSIISSKAFVDSHAARSTSEPNLLVTVTCGKSRYVFIAAPEQQNDSSLVFRHSVTMPVKVLDPDYILHILPGDCQSVEGLIFSQCSKELIRIGNPSINKRSVLSSAFSPVDPTSISRQDVSLGFDPVEGKHKLLHSASIGLESEYRVVTIGDDSWRMVEDGPHFYSRNFNDLHEIYIDGVIYYKGWTKWASKGLDGFYMVAFNCRTESFQAVGLKEFSRDPYTWRLVDFQGKVGMIDYPVSITDVKNPYEDQPPLQLWVMENFENQEWRLQFTRHDDEVEYPKYQLAGSTTDGELIFAVLEFGYVRNNQYVDSFSLDFYDMTNGDFKRSRKVILPQVYGFELTSQVKIMAMSHVETLLSLEDEERLNAMLRIEDELVADMKKIVVMYEDWRKGATPAEIDSFDDAIHFWLEAAADVLSLDEANEDNLENMKVMLSSIEESINEAVSNREVPKETGEKI